MISYRDRILEAIRESEVGLTTVDVAKRSGVSKTTVIKYLSVLRSEGRVEFVEVGPSKLWRISSPAAKSERSAKARQEREALPVVDIDLCDGEEKTVYFSFRVRPEEICGLMKRAKKCLTVSETL
jgi:predicted ArsR family transcriptional regulator